MFYEKRIAIISEGGISKGWGRIHRSLNLTQYLNQSHNLKFEFFIYGSKSVIKQINQINQQNHPVYQITNQKSLFNFLSANDFKLIIFDKLKISQSIVSYIKDELNTKFVIFGSPSPAAIKADLLVNILVDNKFKKINSNYLKGVEYLIFPPEIYRLKKKQSFPKKIKRLTLSFGGSDQSNLSLKTLKNLELSSYKFKINLVLGPLFPFKSEIDNFISKSRKEINLLLNTRNLPELILKSDLLITSPGNTMFTALYLGTPVIAFFQNKIQQKIFNYFPFIYFPSNINNIQKLIDSYPKNHSENKILTDRLKISQKNRIVIDKINQLL